MSPPVASITRCTTLERPPRSARCRFGVARTIYESDQNLLETTDRTYKVNVVSQPAPDLWFKAYVSATIFGAVAAFVALGFLIRSANAAKASADAAKEAADAGIGWGGGGHGERPAGYEGDRIRKLRHPHGQRTARDSKRRRGERASLMPKVVTFGEIMLRLSPPGAERFWSLRPGRRICRRPRKPPSAPN